MAPYRDEKQLIHAACCGDDASFATLYESHVIHIRPVGRAILGTDDGLDDLTQEVFFLAWKALPGFRGDSTFRTWITSITRNQCFALMKRRKKAGEFPFLEIPEGSELRSPWAEDKSRELMEARLDVARLVMGLPPSSQNVVAMSLEGLSDRDIARETNQSLSAVRGRRQRATDLMRKKIHEAPEQSAPKDSLMSSTEISREGIRQMGAIGSRKKRPRKSRAEVKIAVLPGGSVTPEQERPVTSDSDLFERAIADTARLEYFAVIERRREFEAGIVDEAFNRLCALVSENLADHTIDPRYERSVLCRLTKVLAAETVLQEDCARIQRLAMGAYSRELRLNYFSSAVQHFLPGIVSELMAAIATKGGQ